MYPEINFFDWFDPSIPEHFSAFVYFHENGEWPEYFLPDNIIFPTGSWVFDLDYLMIKHLLSENEKIIKSLQELYDSIGYHLAS